MNSEADERPKEVPNFRKVAMVVAWVGAAFMVLVAVNLGLRYGVTWFFNPEYNSHIAVFIGSIAGALFALTNALLLYATLQAQRKAQADTNEQHRELRQDRNYDRLSRMAERIEGAIAAYVVHWGPHMDVLIPGTSPYHGYAGLAKTFEIWVEECTKDKIETRLALAARIDPDMYLTQQVEVIDIMHQLKALVQAIQSSDLDSSGKDHLSQRTTTILTRLSRCKSDLQHAASLLRKFVDDGGWVLPKQHYASDLLHLERKLRDIETLLPEMPYRILTTFERISVTLSKGRPVAMFQSGVVPNFQVDGVTFVSQDKDWVLRFNDGRLTVQVEALRDDGYQLNYLFEPFSFAALLFEADHQGQAFDTKGRWYVEGSYNLLGGHVEDHKRWRIDVGLKDMELLPGESLELTVYTNAKSVEGVEPIKRM